MYKSVLSFQTFLERIKGFKLLTPRYIPHALSILTYLRVYYLLYNHFLLRKLFFFQRPFPRIFQCSKKNTESVRFHFDPFIRKLKICQREQHKSQMKCWSFVIQFTEITPLLHSLYNLLFTYKLLAAIVVFFRN